MNQGSIEVKKTARYFLSGSLEGDYSSICFALHGYGQLASFFSRKFEHHDLKDTLFICPEGLHRFYLKDSSGRVGASWMTKEERLVDIADYCRYLDDLYHAFEDLICKTDKVGILGFSQGVATACRWLANSKYKFDFLINWAGAFPPDLDFQKAIEKMRNIPLWMTFGDDDEYISEEQFTSHIKMLEEKGFQPKIKKFEGKHTIYSQPLLSIMQEI